MRSHRPAERTGTLTDPIAEEAKRLREQAKDLPAGKGREDLIRRARQIEIGVHLAELITSPGCGLPNKRSAQLRRK